MRLERHFHNNHLVFKKEDLLAHKNKVLVKKEILVKKECLQLFLKKELKKAK